MSSKTFFVQKLIETSGISRPSILEIGCGAGNNILPLLEQGLVGEYVGVEPNPRSFARAQEALKQKSNLRLYNQLGYGEVEGLTPDSFDIVISLSVLEHVKQLSKFIDMSVRYAKKGGMVVHRYDLGHALYSDNLKEQFQVFLGNHFPFILPEHKFVSYVSQKDVEAKLVSLGCTITNATYHQMIGHYAIEKYAHKDNALQGAVEELYVWEHKHADLFSRIPVHERERLFSSVAVWSRKGE